MASKDSELVFIIESLSYMSQKWNKVFGGCRFFLIFLCFECSTKIVFNFTNSFEKLFIVLRHTLHTLIKIYMKLINSHIISIMLDYFVFYINNDPLFGC